MEPGFRCEKNSAQVSEANAEAFFRSGFPAGMKAYFLIFIYKCLFPLTLVTHKYIPSLYIAIPML